MDLCFQKWKRLCFNITFLDVFSDYYKIIRKMIGNKTLNGGFREREGKRKLVNESKKKADGMKEIMDGDPLTHLFQIIVS